MYIIFPPRKSYFGVSSVKYSTNIEIYLQRWSSTLCNEKNLQEITSEKNSDNYKSLYYNKGKYGFGFQLPGLSPFNLSKYKNGNLCFSVRYHDDNILYFRVGIESFKTIDTWKDLDTKQAKEEWHQEKISLSQLRENNLRINFSNICQFFMVDLEGTSKGRIDIKEVYWETN
jgi:hypothetical protein